MIGSIDRASSGAVSTMERYPQVTPPHQSNHLPATRIMSTAPACRGIRGWKRGCFPHRDHADQPEHQHR